MLIIPLCLQNIKASSCFVDSLERKLLNQFLDRKNFLCSAWIPPKKCKEVDKRFRKVPRFLITGGHLFGFRIPPCQGKDWEAQTVGITLAELSISIRF